MTCGCTKSPCWHQFHHLSPEDATAEAERIRQHNEHPDIVRFEHGGSQVNLAPMANGLYLFNTYTPHSERGRGGMTRMLIALYAKCDAEQIILWTHPDNPWLEDRLRRSKFGWELVPDPATEWGGKPLYKRLPSVGQ